MRIILNGRLACQDLREQQRYTPTGPALPYLLSAFLRAPYSTRGSEQAVGRVLAWETGSWERTIVMIAIVTCFFEHLGHAKHCSYLGF